MTYSEASAIASRSAGEKFDKAFIGYMEVGVDQEEARIWAAEEAADEYDFVIDNILEK